MTQEQEIQKFNDRQIQDVVGQLDALSNFENVSFCVFQYYAETLPLLLQELDDVYHDVSAVVAETIIQVWIIVESNLNVSMKFQYFTNTYNELPIFIYCYSLPF